MKKKRHFANVSIVKFYYRRILRIWPLYFFVVCLGFFVLPLITWFNYLEPPNFPAIQVGLYAVLMPNISLLFYSPPIFIGQLWSLGVEEQFYAFLPWLVRKARKLGAAIFIFLIFFWLSKFIFILFSKQDQISFLKYLLRFLHTTSFDSLMLGSLGAYIVQAGKFEAILKLIFKRKAQIIFYTILFICIGTGFYFPFAQTQFYSILFLILILNLTVNPDSILNVESVAFGYLRKVSYGIYMFHQIGIFISIKILLAAGINHYLGFLMLSLFITIFMAAISYELYEKKFLYYKKAYERIKTSN